MITLATAATLCLPYLDMVAMLAEKYQEREIMVGQVADDLALITFAGGNGTFTMVAMGKDNVACVLTSGVNFKVLAE